MNYDFDFISQQLRAIIEPATHHTHKLEKKLDCRVYKNAYVAPYFDWDLSIGCVINENGKVVKDSECLEWKENERYYQLGKSVCKHKKVVFLGFILTGFGHSYIDDLRKLWFLETNECKTLLSEGAGLVYTTSWNRPLPKQVIEMLGLAGYDIARADHIKVLTRFDEVYIPDNSVIASDYGRLYCNEYIEAIDRIKKSIPNGNVWGKKIYFSRTKFSKGRNKEYGENAIERVFNKMGYSIFIPEDYSIVEQIQMLKQCKSFAATEGSVAHLSLFCPPKTDVVIINKAVYLNSHQVMINEFADLNVTYIEAHHSIKALPEHPWWGPFYLCINRNLEKYAGRLLPHLPYWLLPSYWEYTRNILYRCYNRARKFFNRVRKAFK